MSRRHSKFVYPLKWEERRPILSDRVFCIPGHFEHHEEYSFPPQEALFDGVRPLNIEFCSGNGEWILQRAQNCPDQNWIAVEWQFDRVSKIWSKRRRAGLKNLMIVLGDARLFVRYYLPLDSVCSVYVNFPDPWPKRRHAKNRLIQSPFLEMLAGGMVEGGRLIMVTDDAPYRDQMIEEAKRSGRFVSQMAPPYYVMDWKGYGGSYFDRLWRSEGRKISYLEFEKVTDES